MSAAASMKPTAGEGVLVAAAPPGTRRRRVSATERNPEATRHTDLSFQMHGACSQPILRVGEGTGGPSRHEGHEFRSRHPVCRFRVSLKLLEGAEAADPFLCAAKLLAKGVLRSTRD